MLFGRILIVGIAAAVIGSGYSVSARAEEESFTQQHSPNDNNGVLQQMLGSAPPMASERGILLLGAYNDVNNNGHRDPGEEEILKGVVCQLDKIDYPLPAFIPGLEPGINYTVSCQSERTPPKQGEVDIFIERRGEIVVQEIPCNSELLGEERSD